MEIITPRSSQDGKHHCQERVVEYGYGESPIDFCLTHRLHVGTYFL